MRKKFILISSFLTFVVIYAIYKYQKYTDLKNNRIGTYDENNFPINNWLVNGIVTQYSSIISLTKYKNLVIETLALIDIEMEEEESLEKNLKCLVKLDNSINILDNDKLIKIRLDRTKYNVSKMWKVRCVLNETSHNYKFENLFVSVIDIRNFANIYNKVHLILFHKPEFFNRLYAKKKSIANCVHMVNNLDQHKLQKLNNWLKIQKEIGFNKIKLYFHLVPKNITEKLLNDHKDFIQIVEHKTNFSHVCQWHFRKYKEQPWSRDYNETYAYCRKSFRKYFEVDDYFIKNTHERVCTNDCLMNFKYAYEYVSNYDFDEFIFPRNFKKNYHLSLDSGAGQSCNNIYKSVQKNAPKEYNIYKYVKRLTKLYGNNVAYFLFENVLFFNDFELIKEKISEVDGLFKQVDYNISSDLDSNITYHFNNASILFTIDRKNDLKFLRSIPEFQHYVNCLNKTIRENEFFNYKWNNPYATVVNNRKGKSIYNTEHTESYNQHFADNIMSKSKKKIVPLEMGFVNHFRDDDLRVNATYPFSYVVFDIEYYNFLYKLSKKYNKR